jgi:hypothetical protein
MASGDEDDGGGKFFDRWEGRWVRRPPLPPTRVGPRRRLLAALVDEITHGADPLTRLYGLLLAHQLCQGNREFMNVVGRQLEEAGLLKEQPPASRPPKPRYGESRRRRARQGWQDDDE